MIYRRNAEDIHPIAEAKVLSAYGINTADMIGQGTEAKVYGLDETQVLKLYADVGQRETLETLQDFYRRLQAHAVPFLLPSIHSIETHSDLLAVTERRIDGEPMENYVTADSRDIEDLYVDAVLALQTVEIIPPLNRHMLLAQDHTGAETKEDWNAFLGDLILDKLPAVLTPLLRDVPDIRRTTKRLIARLENTYEGPVGVIHGDLYPGNILMTDPATVSGIIDFGTFTMIGDPLFDAATACGFYRMYEKDAVAVRRRLLDRVAASLDHERRTDLKAYLLAGAILSCDLYPQSGIEINQTGHFQWAAKILREGF